MNTGRISGTGSLVAVVVALVSGAIIGVILVDFSICVLKPGCVIPIAAATPIYFKVLFNLSLTFLA